MVREVPAFNVTSTRMKRIILTWSIVASANKLPLDENRGHTALLVLVEYLCTNALAVVQFIVINLFVREPGGGKLLRHLAAVRTTTVGEHDNIVRGQHAGEFRRHDSKRVAK